ncbi:GNAT family N-acetyltransferase [Desulfonema magnum]|uniref:GNAT domain-containing protein n=1 Tax=Desulfonema magnum TaxID=45655 RepID=A0A975BML5_9BACT|nr:GNAT family N-acetyltransferase [Desulfonema magnum]QTA87789.1 GNAT domain-containing protein [Desulfonema magnum]
MDYNFDLITINDKAEWNRLMGQCRKADLQQTWEYGESVNKCIEWEPVRQVIITKDQPIAMTQTLVKEIPVIGWVARMQHGPMFIEKNGQSFTQDAVNAIEFLRSHWVDGKHMILHLTPCLVPSDLPKNWAEEAEFKLSDEPLWRSIRIDLSQDSKVIHKKMKRDWKKSLRKIEKYGLRTEVCHSGQDFDFFLEKYKQATIEKGISWPSSELVQELWNEAKSVMSVVFVVKDGKRIAAMILINYASTSHCLVSWSDPQAAKFRAYNFLNWQLILHFQEQKCRWLDLGGIDPENLPGITSFKRGMGGDEYHLAGNFVATPPGYSDGLDVTDYRRGLGHVLPGLELPGHEAVGEEEVRLKVEAIVTEFIKETQSSDVLETSNISDLSLIDGGLIDSLSLISVVRILQETFDIEIEVQDMTSDNFNNVPAMAELVKHKINL